MPGDQDAASEEGALRVLLVDDADPIRRLIAMLLSTHPEFGDVVEASTGRGALEAAARHKPDVILLDEHMPEGNGTEVLPALRALLPEARIVMFSSDDASELPALRLGADAWIPKGSPLDEVIGLLQG